MPFLTLKSTSVLQTVAKISFLDLGLPMDVFVKIMLIGMKYLTNVNVQEDFYLIKNSEIVCL